MFGWKRKGGWTRKGMILLIATVSLCLVFVWRSSKNYRQIHRRSDQYTFGDPTAESSPSPRPSRTVVRLPMTAGVGPAAESPVALIDPTCGGNDVHVANDSGNIFVSLKTASSLHAERLPPLLSTWLQMVNGSQVHIVTDTNDDPISQRAQGYGMTVIESNCSVGHGDDALCCKSGMEYEQYYQAVERGEDYNWFCHFDDDIYVNVPNLVKTLKQYEDEENVYLGHYIRRWPAKLVSDKYVENLGSNAMVKGDYFYYALGPAYCINKNLMTKLPIFFRGGSTFTSTCNKTGFPDDASVGAIIVHYLGFNLTEVSTMINELDIGQEYSTEKKVSAPDCKNLVTVGYSRDEHHHPADKQHHLKSRIDIPFRSQSDDPTGFRSIHCFLFPQLQWC